MSSIIEAIVDIPAEHAGNIFGQFDEMILWRSYQGKTRMVLLRKKMRSSSIKKKLRLGK